MKQGFVKVAAATPDIRVADVRYNTEKLCEMIEEASMQRAKILVFPELCITGYTCSDLFFQDVLLKEAKQALLRSAGYLLRREKAAFWSADSVSVDDNESFGRVGRNL